MGMLWKSPKRYSIQARSVALQRKGTLDEGPLYRQPLSLLDKFKQKKQTLEET